MSDVALTGPYDGHPIRRARKAYTCEARIGWPAEWCGAPIAVGDRYVEGDVNPDAAGGFGFWRICLKCAEIG